jgi:hypothetical protein
MAKKSQKTESPADEQVQQPQLALHEPADIVALRGNVVYIRKFAARENEPQYQECKLDQYRLPPSPFDVSPTPLLERPDLVTAVMQALQGYAARMNVEGTNSTHVQLSSALRTSVKFIEYGWLNGLYRLSDWTPSVAMDLVKKLGTGGWAGALEIDRRTQESISTMSKQDLSQYVKVSKAKSGGYSLSDSFPIKIGSNCRHQEMIGAKTLLVAYLGLPPRGKTEQADATTRTKKRSHEAGMSASQMRQELSWINLLSEAQDSSTALPFVPYPDTVKIAAKHGRPGNRTENLAPESVTALLKEANWWIIECADSIVGLVGDIAEAFSAAKSAGEALDPRCAEKAMRESEHRLKVEGLMGQELTTIGLKNSDSGLSLKRIVYGLSSACFVTIAFFNARRKNELVHRKNGLYRQGLRLVHADLKLYECDFYIEKTYKIYVPFYVGQATRNAIEVLERMSDLAREIDSLRDSSVPGSVEAKEDKLFHLPRIVGKRLGGGEQWFDFSASAEGISREFVDRALGADRKLRVHPHMFRRAYALIYHYRYEFATLQALAQQLGHFDLETVHVYVTDRPGGVSTATAASYARRSPKVEEARAAAIAETEEEIKKVGIERVRELARQIIDGESTALGGFARLVTRFHQVLGRRLDYSRLAPDKKAKVLAAKFSNQGHEFRPMRHANCVASASRRSKSAGCYSKRNDRNSPEDANPTTCGGCAYSHYTQQHIRLWEEDEVELRERVLVLGSNSIAGRSTSISLANLQEAIRLRRHRADREMAEVA